MADETKVKFEAGDLVHFRYGTTILEVLYLTDGGHYIVKSEDGTLFSCEPDEIVPKGATSEWGREGRDEMGFPIED